MEMRANTALMLGLALLAGTMAAATAFSGWMMASFGMPLGDITPWSFLALPEGFRADRPEAFSRALQLGGAVGALITGGMAHLALKAPRENIHGDARWATETEIRRAGLLESQGVILGKLGSGRRAPWLRTTRQDYSNMLVVAPPGAGKTTGLAAPTLLTYAGSVIVLDVKGELFDLTARTRERMGDRIFRFSPYDACSHCYNPLERIAAMRDDPERQFTELRRIASYLLVAKGKADAPFITGARELFYAVASVVVQSDTPTIGQVFALLTPGGEAGTTGMADTFRLLATRAPLPAAQTILRQFAAYEPKQVSTYLSVLKSAGLEAWADPAIDRATSRNDIPFDDLRRDPASIYVCVRANDMEVIAPLARLFFQHAVATLQSAEPAADEPFPVLFLMDEFYQLGRMDTVLKATTTLRSFGGRMLMIVQGIPWLEETYDRAAVEGLLGVCQLQVYMAVNDQRTKKMLSEALGSREIESRSESVNRTTGRFGVGRTASTQRHSKRLVAEDEIGRIGTQTLLIFAQNCRPIRARKAYFRDDPRMTRILEKAEKHGDPAIPELRQPRRSPGALLEHSPVKPEPGELQHAVAARDAAMQEASRPRRTPRGEYALHEGMSIAESVRQRLGMVG